jgi:hypothetical protein
MEKENDETACILRDISILYIELRRFQDDCLKTRSKC